MELSEIAQTIMDLYYQQYKSDEDFFEFSHFEFIAGAAHSQLLQEEYEKSYKMALAEKGKGEAQLNPQWFVTVEKDVVASDNGDKEIVLDSCPFSFRFDKQSCSIQGVYPISGKCGEFIRTTVDESWKSKKVPANDIVFWFPLGNKIIFNNVKCGLKKVKVTYIPGTKDMKGVCMVAEVMAMDIIQRGLNLMFAARQGKIVDMTNNQNPNSDLATEIDTTMKNLKTNP